MENEKPNLPVFLQQFLAISPGGVSHTVPLMACMAGVLATCAWMLGGVSMAISAAIAVALMLAVAPMISPDVLMKLLRARPLDIAAYPAIYEMAAMLAHRAGLDYLPKLAGRYEAADAARIGLDHGPRYTVLGRVQF